MTRSNKLLRAIPSDLGVPPTGKPYFVVDYDPDERTAVIMIEGQSYKVDQDMLREATL